MSGCGDHKNPLQRSGTSQQQRLLSGLQQHYVNIDERDYADWIFFASELSKYINYFHVNNTATGDWTPFFSSDVSALLSIAAIQNVDQYRREIKERFDFLKDEDNAANMNEVKEKLTELFAALLSFSKAIDSYLTKLPQELTIKANIRNLVQLKLAPSLRRLLAYFKGARDLGFLQPTDFDGWRVFNQQVVNAQHVISNGLSLMWQTNRTLSWKDYVADANLAKEESIFGDATWSDFRRISHAAHHNLFSSIFDQYLSLFASMVKDAENELLKTLEQWDSHPAHYALFLGFLKLFKAVQNSANTITQRHLDFYYREVLRLFPKAAQPNSAHILVALAKQVEDAALKENTLLKGGKDSAGKEVLYGLNKEETFNKANVALLKAVYKGDKNGADDHIKEEGSSIKINNKGRLFAAPVVNSEENKEWHPFVHKIYNEGVLIDLAMHNALIGFAIASHYLFLSEGERKVYIRLSTSNNVALQKMPLVCYLTTEKEWYQVEGNPTFSSGTMTDTSACAELSFTLTGNAPAITAYNNSVHGGTFTVATPVLKVYLANEDGTDQYPYDLLSDITINKLEVKVEVGMDSGYNQKGLKQLLLSSDFGPVDPSRPFQPFGPAPAIGSRLVIGHKEVFMKKNAAVRLNIEWKGLPSKAVDIDYVSQFDGGNFPNVAVKHLDGGIWKDTAAHEELFDYSGSEGVLSTITLPFSFTTLNDNTIVSPADDYSVFDISKSKGYMAIQLTQEFGHKKYQEDLTAYLIAQAKTPPSGTKPTEPYTPTVQSIYLSYTANVIENLDSSSESLFENRGLFFYHLYPFGEAEQHAFLSGSSAVYLFPQFRHTAAGLAVHHVGEFYIGLQNLQPRQSVNILFQVLEGSTDPLVEKPDEHVFWSYLVQNEWRSFEKQGISDATRQLVQSGIITFIIPAEATTDHTILPAGYIWLRASVSEAAEAVCKLLSVDAQAAGVTFRPNNNANDFLNTPLPAGTISKLKTPDAAVRKIEQPYSSFGGRAKETNHQFYRRVSERLRHKGRAITIWDYEHLVLEAFPQIHKVKCLNHTKIEDGEYNEMAPGYVGLITVPTLVNRNDANPLRPYTAQNTLLEIEEYLKKKVSCHVKLRVRNPQFEEVRLSFALRLMKGYNDFTFYAKQLKQEITQFLTPWAFTTGVDIQFGGKIHKSVLINFIEERPYVDFITNVEMYHRVDEKSTTESGDLDEITASTARSILVSAPASKHTITEIRATEDEEATDCPAKVNNDRKNK